VVVILTAVLALTIADSLRPWCAETGSWYHGSRLLQRTTAIILGYSVLCQHTPSRHAYNVHAWPRLISLVMIAAINNLLLAAQREGNDCRMVISFNGKKMKVWMCVIHLNFTIFLSDLKLACILYISVYYTQDFVVWMFRYN